MWTTRPTAAAARAMARASAANKGASCGNLAATRVPAGLRPADAAGPGDRGRVRLLSTSSPNLLASPAPAGSLAKTRLRVEEDDETAAAAPARGVCGGVAALGGALALALAYLAVALGADDGGGEEEKATEERSLKEWLADRLPEVPRSLTVRAAAKFTGGGDEGRPASRRFTYNFIADVVEDVASSLVYIEIKDLGVRDYFTGLPTTSSNGSGFVVKDDGLILTNAHVVINKPNASVQVRLQDGRTFTGTVEDVDVKSDLATVRIPCKGLPVMPLGASSSVRPGEFVIAMGSPLSLSNTITTGVVSTAARQRAELGLRDRDVPEYIQTDAAITFGNSGGPLVNLDGEAIGINSMKVTPGISFAIPIDYAKEFLTKSEESRRGRRGGSGQGRRYLGITMLTINPQIVEELRARLEMPANVNSGIVIFRIIRGSPADKAGLLPGDIVTHINKSPVHGSRDVYKHLEGPEPELRMRVVRRDKYIEVVTRPEKAAA